MAAAAVLSCRASRFPSPQRTTGGDDPLLEAGLLHRDLLSALVLVLLFLANQLFDEELR